MHTTHKTIEIEEGQQLLLLSDLHIGSSQTDYNLLSKTLESARENKSQVLINGDVLHNVRPGQRHYAPSGVASRLRDRDDFYDEGVRWTKELLRPVRGSIKLLSRGNHDMDALSDGTDPVQRLCEEMNCSEAYGNYSGIIPFKIKDKKKTYQIYYHHGTIKGANPFEQVMRNLEGVDVIWLGHSHQAYVRRTRKLTTTSRGKTKYREILLVRTPSFCNQEPYSEVKGYSPEPLGSITLTLNSDKIQVTF